MIDLIFLVLVVLLLSSFVSILIIEYEIPLFGFRIDSYVILIGAAVLAWLGVRLISSFTFLTVFLLAMVNMSRLSQSMGNIWGPVYILFSFIGLRQSTRCSILPGRESAPCMRILQEEETGDSGGNGMGVRRTASAVMLAFALGMGAMYLYMNQPGGRRTAVSNEEAQSDKENRYLTIVNKTGQIINEMRVTVGDGSEIESLKQIMPDEKSYSVKIPDSFREYSTFTVTFLDRYGLLYEKTVDQAAETGRTEVVVTKEDYVEQKGDWKRRVDQWFNGD